jgi:hypothetical protein
MRMRMVMVNMLAWMRGWCQVVILMIVARMVVARHWGWRIVFAYWSTAGSTTRNRNRYVFAILVGRFFKFQLAAFTHMMAHY